MHPSAKKSKGGRLAGASLQKPVYKKTERLLPDIQDFDDFTEPKKYPYYKQKTAGWFSEVVKKRYAQLKHFLFEDSLISLLIGCICACISFAVDMSYEHLHYARRTLFDMADKIPILGLVFWVSFLLTLVLLAALVCKYISKEAVGSGIPNIRVILDGFMLANYFSLKTLFAKIIGLIFTLGSGIPIGKEGPFIHIGAIVGVSLSKLGSKINGKNSIISHQDRDIQNILSGCAAGIACTFSAPVGAVLYAIECTARFSAIRNLWRSFLCTTVAALTFKYLNMYVAPENVGKTILAYYETHLPNKVFVVAEIPIFIFLGIICGIAGSAFVCLYKAVYLFRKNNSVYKKIFGTSSMDLSFTIFMALLVGFITYPGSNGVGQFIGGKFTLREQLSDFISNCTMSGMDNLGHCSDDIVYRWTPHVFGKSFSHFYALFGFLIVMFFMVAVVIGLPIPASMFVPTFVIGACGGRILGEALYLLFPNGIGNNPIFPGLYAIVGAAAFTGAVTHSVSIAVIIVEATGQLSSLVPVMIALMTAITVAGFLTPNIYDVMVVLKNYPHLAELPPNRAVVHELTVEQFMEHEPECISMESNYIDIRRTLIETKDVKTYPVVNNKEEKILIGTVARRYLHFLLLNKIGPDPVILGQSASEGLRKRSSAGNLANLLMTDRSMSGNTLLSTSPLHQNLKEKMSPLAPLLRQQKTVSDFREISNEGSKKAKIDDKIELDEEAVEPIPCQLVNSTSLFKVYNLFMLLGLREAFVSDRGRLIGKVTYNELKEVVADVYKGNAIHKYNTATVAA